MEGLADYMVQQYTDITAREIVKAMSLSLQKKASGGTGRPLLCLRLLRHRSDGCLPCALRLPQEEGTLQMRAARASQRAEGARSASAYRTRLVV